MVYFTTCVCTTMLNLINMADNDGNTLLINAVRDRKVTMVDVLLRAGADVWHKNNAGESAWTLAGGHEQIWALVCVRGVAAVAARIDDPAHIDDPVSPPAASREPSPEPSSTPQPQPLASREVSSEASQQSSPVSDDSSILSDTSPKSSPKSSPEASSEASPERSPDSDAWKRCFVETFVLNKRQRLASPDSP